MWAHGLNQLQAQLIREWSAALPKEVDFPHLLALIWSGWRVGRLQAAGHSRS